MSFLCFVTTFLIYFFIDFLNLNDHVDKNIDTFSLDASQIISATKPSDKQTKHQHFLNSNL